MQKVPRIADAQHDVGKPVTGLHEEVLECLGVALADGIDVAGEFMRLVAITPAHDGDLIGVFVPLNELPGDAPQTGGGCRAVAA